MSKLITLVSVFVAITAAGLLASQSTAGAHHCSGSAEIGDSGGEASASCHGNYPGAAPSSSTSMSALWSSHCAHYRGYTPWTAGATVKITRGAPLSELEVWSSGLDPSGEYAWFNIDCISAGGDVLGSRSTFFTVTPPVPPEVLRERAVARIDPPSPSLGTSPPLDRFAVVNLETWFWTDVPWEPIVESESSGFTTVEVFARPETLTWVFSNGESLTCDGPGIEWSEVVDAGGTYCGHTFTRGSAGEPGDAFEGTATIRWVFSWAINGNDQGDFGSVDTVSGFSLQVGEIQVLETSGR